MAAFGTGLKVLPQLHQHVNESAQRRDLRPLGELCQRRFFCSRNSRPIANALDGRAWQYTTRACVRNSPVEESSRMTLPGSQGQSVKMRAPCEVTFSVQAYPTCGGPCPFETKTRNFWSSRFSRRPVNSPALMGLLLKGAGLLLPIWTCKPDLCNPVNTRHVLTMGDPASEICG